MDLLNKLQKVQNHIIFRKKKKYDHVSPLLKSLHWLQIQERIDYKIAVLVFKCLSNQAPLYLSDLVQKKVNSRLLRSFSDSTLLTVPRKQLKTYSKRCFEHYGPQLWNFLPREVREKENLNTLKMLLHITYFVNLLTSCLKCKDCVWLINEYCSEWSMAVCSNQFWCFYHFSVNIIVCSFSNIMRFEMI